MKKYSVTIKNNANETRIYTTVATNTEDALEKVGNTYRFTTDNLPITEIFIKKI